MKGPKELGIGAIVVLNKSIDSLLHLKKCLEKYDFDNKEIDLDSYLSMYYRDSLFVSKSLMNVGLLLETLNELRD